MTKLSRLFLIGSALAFIIVIGGAVYEHVAMVPVWKQAAPRSLAMYAGPYAPLSERFWESVHPIAVLLLIAALIANWKTARRGSLLLVVAGYIAVLIITGIFYVPELLSIIRTPCADHVDAALTARAHHWETLSLLRLGVILLLAIILLNSFFKEGDRGQSA